MANLKNTTINDTGFLKLPVGNSSQRPNTPSTGDMRFNNDFKQVEWYDGSNWQPPAIVTSNLVLWLEAGNTSSYTGSGSTWTDLSSNSNNCNFNSLPSFNSSGWFSFNGSNFGTITNNSSLNYTEGQTTMFLIRHSYTSGRRNPWDQAYGGFGTWTHEQGNNFNYYFGTAGSNNHPYVGRTSGSSPRNVWYVMTSMRNTTQHIWYLNNSVSATGTNPYGVLPNNTCRLLNRWHGRSTFL